MERLEICESQQLYNLLNQHRCVSRLAETNFLCLMDARTTQDYRVSHIVTAKNVNEDSGGGLLLPEAVEIDTMRHVVVYDSDSSCLQGQGRAVKCAMVLAVVSLYPVKILKGGFQKFSALYPFLRTEKILFTITELEHLRSYPVEILAGQLYMGDLNQGMDPDVTKNLKISAIVSICESKRLHSLNENQSILNISLCNMGTSDLYSIFENTCSFIAENISKGSRVLVVSAQARSRCSAVAMAFLMSHLNYTLEEAWRLLQKCKPDMRPNSGFIQQLSDWELHTRGQKVTDISSF